MLLCHKNGKNRHFRGNWEYLYELVQGEENGTRETINESWRKITLKDFRTLINAVINQETRGLPERGWT